MIFEHQIDFFRTFDWFSNSLSPFKQCWLSVCVLLYQRFQKQKTGSVCLISLSGQRSVTARRFSALWSAVVPRAPCWPVPSSSLYTTAPRSPTRTTGKSSSRASRSRTNGRWGIWIRANRTASGWMKASQREESGQGNSGDEPLHFNKLLILQREGNMTGK